MNWSIKYVCAAMIGFIFCIHSTRAQDKSGLPGLDPSFPWAKVMLDKQDEIFTLRHVEADVAATINLSPELQGLPWGKKVPEKDGAANNKKLGLTETVAKNKIDPNNPQQKGETLLDLTSYPATISYGLATLVDDVTEITVIDITENPENKTALFVHKHNGTALWSVDRSFKTSKNCLEQENTN